MVQVEVRIEQSLGMKESHEIQAIFEINHVSFLSPHSSQEKWIIDHKVPRQRLQFIDGNARKYTDRRLHDTDTSRKYGEG